MSEGTKMGEIQKVDNRAQVPQAQDASTIMQVISRAASDPAVDIGKLERLMDMYERVEGKKAEQAFNESMTAAQSEMGRVSADANNPQTRSKYASYAALDRALRPIYTAHGFALSFDEGESPGEGWVRVLCYVSHRNGHCKTYGKNMPADGKGAKGGDVMTKTHAAGAAMSYGMRYLLKGIFNVAVGEDDDDGNGATLTRVSQEQAANLRVLIEEVGANEDAFLRFYKAPSIEEFAAHAYKDAVNRLERKRKKA